jgi:hypothetical protein
MRVLAIALTLATLPGAAAAVSSTFAYQGSLQDGGVPASGSYDLRFELLTQAGAVVGTVLADDVAVQGGRLSLELDFGTVITSADYQLQVAVRAGASTGAYTTLTPASRIRPTPQAQVAGIAAEAVAVSVGSISSTSIANGSIGSVDIDASQVQRRVGAGCGTGEAIRAIAADGSVSCIASGEGVPRVFGDGSRGPLNVSSGFVVLDSANLQFESITIAAGATLYVPSGAVVRVRGALTVDGLLVVTPGPPALALLGAHPAPANHFGHSAFGGGETTSGSGTVAPVTASAGIGGREANYSGAFPAQVALQPQFVGGGAGGNGAGAGGDGGGFAALLAQGEVVIRGEVRADGRAPNAVTGRGGGGGGGGLLILASRSAVQNTGFIYAVGGNGAPAGSMSTGNGQVPAAWGAGGGGGGGLVHLIAPVINAGRVVTTGGTGGATAATAVYPAGTYFQTYGGGGAGSAYGRGGAGNSVSGDPQAKQFVFIGAGQSGAVGALLQTLVDPTSLF